MQLWTSVTVTSIQLLMWMQSLTVTPYSLTLFLDVNSFVCMATATSTDAGAQGNSPAIPCSGGACSQHVRASQGHAYWLLSVAQTVLPVGCCRSRLFTWPDEPAETGPTSGGSWPSGRAIMTQILAGPLCDISVQCDRQRAQLLSVLSCCSDLVVPPPHSTAPTAVCAAAVTYHAPVSRRLTSCVVLQMLLLLVLLCCGGGT